MPSEDSSRIWAGEKRQEEAASEAEKTKAASEVLELVV
jgi:hypothetical protein